MGVFFPCFLGNRKTKQNKRELKEKQRRSLTKSRALSNLWCTCSWEICGLTRQRNCVKVWMKERDRVRVWKRVRENECVCESIVCVCLRERVKKNEKEWEGENACVCVRERESCLSVSREMYVGIVARVRMVRKLFSWDVLLHLLQQHSIEIILKCRKIWQT